MHGQTVRPKSVVVHVLYNTQLDQIHSRQDQSSNSQMQLIFIQFLYAQDVKCWLADSQYNQRQYNRSNNWISPTSHVSGLALASLLGAVYIQGNPDGGETQAPTPSSTIDFFSFARVKETVIRAVEKVVPKAQAPRWSKSHGGTSRMQLFFYSSVPRSSGMINRRAIDPRF